MDLLPWLLGFVVKYPEITVFSACFLLLFCRLRRTRKRPDRLPTNWPVVGALPAIMVNAGHVHEWVTKFLHAAGMSYIVEGPWGSPGDVLVMADPTNVMPVHGEELAATIARIDANGGGCVDMDEFAELYESVMRVGGGGDTGDAEEASMREAFDVFDRNGDGFITVDELGAVLASLGIKQGRTPEDCGLMIGQVDRDGDGCIDFLEFKQMMRGGAFARVR